MKSADIRSLFLKFFENKGHQIVPSSSLVPADDPSLLFTNAGMNQFKDVFLGKEERNYSKATSAQRCVRAGGKHNDLENVGYTARHHTFFEMLGNFSFGDYFKREAIKYAWEFLTVTLGLSEEKLWITVYEDDQESEDIWLKEMKVSRERFSRLGEKDNFWTMGDTGPCGPCSEIFYDHGEAVAGDPPGGLNDDGDRYIEIWNMVFMQYHRTTDGKMHPLPKPSIDTGMGLERISAVMQGVHSNYEIDSFQHILNAASILLGGVPTTEGSLRVIADHIRSCAFLIADGVLPSNEGRGYTLRRIIRRACRHGHKLSAPKTFFYRLLPAVIEAMGDAANSLVTQKMHIESIIKREEEQFNITLDKGMKLLEADIACLLGKCISGETIFMLYDTYGFPVDLTNDIARERGLMLDLDEYEICMEAQRERARSANNFSVDYSNDIILEGETAFTGYDRLSDTATVVGIFINGKPVDSIESDDERQTKATIVFDKTPFYAESGGQVGDVGQGYFEGGQFTVSNTKKSGLHHLHNVEILTGKLKVGLEASLKVSELSRSMTAANHSATHLLHAALREILGEHVQQKGSLVTSSYLRFDFSHPQALTNEQLKSVQRLVNKEIRKNTRVSTEEMSITEAKAKGAIALFNEKYEDKVRVLTMGQIEQSKNKAFSVELCGGTHVVRTGNIGVFVIKSESGIASGIRRIDALTGDKAEAYIESVRSELGKVAEMVKGDAGHIPNKVQVLFDKNRELEKQVGQLQQQLASMRGNDLTSQAVEVNGVKVLAVSLGKGDAKLLRNTVDQLKNRLGECIVFLAIENQGKAALAAGVTKSLTDRIKAGDLLKAVAKQLGGTGGGRSDFAQGGGNNVAALPTAIASVVPWVEERL